jgi:dTDP-4-amino-4,6-dideoxygalactose transaminase
VAGDFLVAEKVASEILSLPMFPGLSAEQQAMVAARLNEFVAEVADNERRAAA